MGNPENETDNIPVSPNERVKEAFSLACDLAEPLLENGNSEALAKLRRLKSLLAISMMGVINGKDVLPVNGQDSVVKDYHQELVELIIELALKMMKVDAEAGDCLLEVISLQAETVVERINLYFEVKTRSTRQNTMVEGG